MCVIVVTSGVFHRMVDKENFGQTRIAKSGIREGYLFDTKPIAGC